MIDGGIVGIQKHMYSLPLSLIFQLELLLIGIIKTDIVIQVTLSLERESTVKTS